MKASEFVQAVSQEARLTQKESSEVIEKVFTALAKGLVAGEKITISGFGSFETKVKPARKGINPATKQPIDIPERRVVVYKPSKNLKDQVAK